MHLHRLQLKFPTHCSRHCLWDSDLHVANLVMMIEWQTKMAEAMDDGQLKEYLLIRAEALHGTTGMYT
ncbi:hypothetical protein J5N97_009512 [Dioscorea zingiberensis]|uniref:Uncharacterized protein n=1 Tax=Dioscorea zingiberensis TaxID=325984 RepID=A0A9D5HMR7_9LILI|nr:hypothetical protein J5N97_009512 [Dioscorea zingiberensis]